MRKRPGTGKSKKAATTTEFESRPRMLIVSCRFVPTDQWFISHVRTSWTVKNVKIWLLARCMPNEIPIPADFRPPSPVTFATTTARPRAGTGATEDDVDFDDFDLSDGMTFGTEPEQGQGEGAGEVGEGDEGGEKKGHGDDWDSPESGDDADSVSDYGSVVGSPPFSDPEHEHDHEQTLSTPGMSPRLTPSPSPVQALMTPTYAQVVSQTPSPAPTPSSSQVVSRTQSEQGPVGASSSQTPYTHTSQPSTSTSASTTAAGTFGLSFTSKTSSQLSTQTTQTNTNSSDKDPFSQINNNFSVSTLSSPERQAALQKAYDLCTDYQLFSFNGQRFEENLPLETYNLPAYSMIEIHRRYGYVDLKRHPDRPRPRRKEKVKEGHGKGKAKGKSRSLDRGGGSSGGEWNKEKESEWWDNDHRPSFSGPGSGNESEEDDPYLYPYFEQKIRVWHPTEKEKAKDKDKDKESKFPRLPSVSKALGNDVHWKKRIVMIWHGCLYIIEDPNRIGKGGGRAKRKRIVQASEMKLLVKRNLDDLAEISGNVVDESLQDINAALTEEKDREQVIIAKFDKPPDEIVFGFTAENARVYHDLLRILHRSHWNPSTHLKTNFIRTFSKMPTFAKPRGHHSRYNSTDTVYLDDYDDDDDGADMMSIESGNLGGVGGVGLPQLSLAAGTSAALDSISLDSEFDHGTGTSGAGTTGTMVGSATSQVFSEMRLDAALPYPEWRRDLVARAREVCRGYRYPFISPCGHSLAKMKPSPTNVKVDGLQGSFTLTVHGIAKEAALYEYYRRIAMGVITLEDIENGGISLIDMVPPEYNVHRLVDGEEGLRCPEEEDAPSENEWESWKADIERQKPRLLRYAGLSWSGEDGEETRYYPTPGSSYGRRGNRHQTTPDRRPSPINIEYTGHRYGQVIHDGPRSYQELRSGGSAPRSRSQSSSTPATSPLASPLIKKSSLSQLISRSPKTTTTTTTTTTEVIGHGHGLRRSRSKTLASPSSPTFAAWGQTSGSAAGSAAARGSTSKHQAEPSSPRVIPPSPMIAESHSQPSTAPPTATLPMLGPLHQPLHHHKGLGKSPSYSAAAGRLVGKLHRPRSSNQVSGNSPFGLTAGERQSIFSSVNNGKQSSSAAAFTASPGTNALTSPGFTVLDRETPTAHGRPSTSSQHERERDKDKGKQKEVVMRASMERIKDKEKKPGKDGKPKSFSVREALRKGKENLTRGFDDALDFVDGK